MKPDTRNMTMTEKADAAFRQAAFKVIERARQTGTPVIVWEDGRIVKRSWEEMLRELTETSNQTLEKIGEDDGESATDQACGEIA